MVEYDAEVIRDYANRLYRSARSMMAVYAVLGALIGVLVGWGLGKSAAGVQDYLLVGSVAVCGVVGWAVGRERAFRLMLQAQTALCQAQIEENTRNTRN